jgi:hypothetical protein
MLAAISRRRFQIKMLYPARPLDITETTLAANLFSSSVFSPECSGGCGDGPTGCSTSGKLS